MKGTEGCFVGMSSILGVTSAPSIAAMYRVATSVTPPGSEAVASTASTSRSQPAAVGPLQPARGPAPGGDSKDVDAAAGRGARRADLSTEDELALRELASRDTEVRSHEQAHVAAGGQYVNGGPSYAYEVGPDGRRYAVEGEVNIDVSRERDPEATIRKAQVVRQAALAPADPSAQDRMAASRAAEMEREARVELSEEIAPTREKGAARDRPDEPAPAASTDGGSSRASQEDESATPASSSSQFSVRV
jgi:hypothetical protein